MRPIREIGMPTGVERLPGGPRTDSPHRPTLVRTIAQRADQLPDHPALVELSSGETLGYGRLVRRIRRTSRQLRARGIGPEDRVGVHLERSIDQIVALLAVLDNGAAFVPLDPRYPKERLESMVRDAGCRWILTTTDHADSDGSSSSGLELAGLIPGVLDFEELRHSDPGPVPPATATELADALAYVLFTSGSTGSPKGVMIPNRALDWYSRVCGQHYGLGPTDRLLQLASASFDISIGEIFPALAQGTTLILAPSGPVDAVELLETCARHRVTVLFPATALWHELARALAEDNERLPPSLRLVSFGGEKVAANRLADWRRAVGGRVLLINGYGPTETTVEATLHRLTSAMITAEPGEAQAIGHPVEGVIPQILDARGQSVAPGRTGELWLDSPGLARGYLGQSARTAEHFVPDPNGRVPGGRVYRTGDLVRQRSDGCLEILGRRDRQTKIRGFRVEPGEIEHHLRQHPEVAEAAVVVLAGSRPDDTAGEDTDGDDTRSDDTGGDDRWLAAFVGLRGGPSSTHRGANRPKPADGSRGATGILGVGGAGEAALGARALRSFLRDRLPAHLVPQAIHVLDRLPLDGNLKIDHRALAEHALATGGPSTATTPVHDTQGSPRGGRSPAEALLAELWRRILRVGSVTPNDDFFALGGDSILGIRIAARAQRAGLPITPRDLFDHPKLATLAALAERRAAATRSPEAESFGPPEPARGAELPLTPVQRWFFDAAELDQPWHFNQSSMVTVEGRVEASFLDRALRRLVAHHDALRLRFRCHRDGRVSQRVAEQEPRQLLLQLDLSALPVERRRGVFARAADQVQGRLDLEHGPLLRAALVHGLGRPRLLLAIHHLVVDGVSWGILLGDLETLVLGELEGGAPRPLARSTSYGRWALLQTHLARSGALDSEIPRWTTQSVPATPLPTDHRLGDGNSLASEARVSRALGRRSTHDLLRRAGEAYRTRINDLLVTALAMAVGRWAGAPLWVDLEGHGREELAPGFDLSRTVGWFTSTFPVAVELPGLAARASERATRDRPITDPGAADAPSTRQLATWLTTVKEILRGFPNHGIGFGILHDLADERAAAPLRTLPRPEISFNYLGQLDALLAESRIFAACGEGRGREKGRGGRRPYVFEVDGGVVEGRLWIHWNYSRHLHHRATVEALADGFRTALEALIDHCLDPAAGALTPSDVPLAELDAATLAQRFTDPREIEDLYPLAPMQKGMLFHSLLEPESPVYLEQASWEVVGPFEPDPFRAAWQQCLDRHGILRTAFHWRGLDPPLQAVYRWCRLPWTQEDWGTLSAAEQQIRFDALLATDRRLGFELDRPPLTRITLVRLGPERHRFLWTYHHALLDGWSISLLFDEVFTLYGATRRGTPVTARATVPFRDYVAWLAARRGNPAAAESGRPPHGDEAERFFQRDLRGFSHPTPLPVVPPAPGQAPRGPQDPSPMRDGWRDAGGAGVEGGDKAAQDTLERLLEETLGRELEAFARQHRVTAGTLVQAAWGLLLARARGADEALDDVLFGMTVSGRPADLAGADSLVGPMINTLPVRLRLPRTGSRIAWLQTVQSHLSELHQHTACSLVDLRRWASVPAGRELFETLLVFENYPVEHGALEEEQRRGDLVLRGFRGFSETNYPLTLAVIPGRRWRFDLAWNRDRFSPAEAHSLLDQLEALLQALVAAPEEPLATLDLGNAESPRRAPPPATSTHPTPTPTSPSRQASADPGSSTTLDSRIEALWRDVLGTDRIEPEADFFELGGHSLMAMGLLARLRQELGVELPLKALFDQPTLGALCARVGEALRHRGHLEIPDPEAFGVIAAERPEHPPLASNQHRLWILDRLEPADPAYHIAGAWYLQGDLDPAALDAAVHTLIDRHEALRTCFPEHAGEPYQAIRPPGGPRSPLPHVDLRRLGPGGFDEARRQADRLALRPFDLGQGPLLRIVRMGLDERRHLLVKVVHHIVSDAVSETLFYRELALLYRAARRRHPFRLPRLVAQPADAVPWQARHWPESVWRPRLDRLRQQLADLPILELPRDRRGDPPHRPGHLRHSLPHSATAPLARLAASRRASLSMLLTTGLAALLRRLGAGDDLVLGSPVANRPTPGHGRWIGFFVETVILRLGLLGTAGLGATLAQVREVALEAWSHQDIPFDRLVDALAPDRRPGRPPLAQVMIDWVEAPVTTLPLDGARGAWVELAGSSGNYDLALTGTSSAGRIVLDFEFDAARYDRTSVQRWVRALERMLLAALDDPERPLDQLPWLSPAERHQLVVELAGKPQARSASGRPTLGASTTGLTVIDGHRGASYEPRQLSRRIAGWRRAIEGLVLDPPHRETVVGVLVERSLESLAASLGVLASGAVWFPIDPEDPPAHQQTLVTTTGVTALVGPPDRLAPLGRALGQGWASRRPGWVGDDGAPGFETLVRSPAPHAATVATPHSEARPEEPPDPRRAAAILHTSGSTGNPKGVVLTWGALEGYAADAADRYRIDSGARVLQFAHWTFDLWFEEVLPALLMGATLVLRDPETATPEGFWAFCLRHDLTHATLPTAFWHRLVDALPETADELAPEVAKTPLRHLIVGGEKVDSARLRHWRGLGRRMAPTGQPGESSGFGSLVFHDTYGPTEATVVCARARPLAPTDPTTRHDGDLGCPIAGARLVVVDRALEPTPLGVAGELAIAGHGLARGYHAQGATTAGRFVPDPSADGSAERPAGGRWYLSGDRCRRLADGSLQFLGRTDRQVKIRGFRVEPAAIEATLRRLPGLRDAAVGTRSLAESNRLVAWTVPADPAAPPSVEALRAHCDEHLPRHLHPTVWVSIDRLPLDRRGKVDVGRLPAPEALRPELATVFRPPSGVVEEALARVWSEVLELESLGADDDFFDLGGDSLLAIRATDGVRRSGFALEPMDLLRHPTVARLARAVVAVSTRPGDPESNEAPLDVPPLVDIPLTPIQQWFFDWRLGNRDHFNQSFRLVAKRPLDPARVERAVASLLAHHETLRLRFEPRHEGAGHGAEGWRQVLVSVEQARHARAAVTWDLSRLPTHRADTVLAGLCATLQGSLDLSRGPLFRVAVLRLPGGAEQLLIVAHHLLVDGVSWAVVLTDFETAYGQAEGGAPTAPDLPPTTTPYRRWATALAHRARQEDVRAELPYWRSVLGQRQTLPRDAEAASAAISEPAQPWVRRRLDPQTTRRLLREGRSIEPRLLTALLRVVASWSDRSGLLFELEGHGRGLPASFGDPSVGPHGPDLDVSRTVGWFTSTYPVWLERVGSDLEAQVAAVARQLAEVPARGFHFGLLRHLAPGADAIGGVDGVAELRRLPGPEINFNYLGRFESSLGQSELFEPRSLDPGPEQGDAGETLHLFDVGCRVAGGELVVDWTYDPLRIRRATAEALTERTLDDLRRIAEIRTR